MTAPTPPLRHRLADALRDAAHLCDDTAFAGWECDQENPIAGVSGGTVKLVIGDPDRLAEVAAAVVQADLDTLRELLAARDAENARLRERLAGYGTPVLGPVPPPPVDQGALKRLAVREEMERTGTTGHEFAVGRALCPARLRCPSGLLALFQLTKRGRLPVHRGNYGPACEGSGKKPTVVLRRAAASSPAAAD